ncbi:hypothetical protein GCM10010277_55210 [Streptomyces longisporoflavus]|uniref:hypothetical protein n=1 Tax=Streptomyces longisporoflavus TaxID=28044 RepID=UPI00167D8775|nr:hypothetical protein [Streptomyces longisporoflavus]GGV55285.1 hypothetical protein GCM10010277_55210 [Streptomyces longisporoflavus]
MSSSESASDRPVSENSVSENPVSESAGAKEGKAPGWFPALFLFGVVSLVFRFGGIWSWWALLWAPVFLVAVGISAYEWRLVARNRWRMPAGEWILLAVAHAGCAASLAVMLGVLHY